ncbi:MAG: tRNA (adenosine(37)-N6)-dimethylallyltransferase MiaA [Acidimicrobiales bacterium]
MRHLALVGPTAVGKSSLAMALARSRDGVELVSVDSMQVYRGMDIGTAKPTPAERAEVPHHLIDLADPSERFTVTRFARLAADAVDAIEARGRTAILVGGTGLYLQAVLGDVDPPGEWPDVRAALATEGTEALIRRLRQLDPVALRRIEPGNRRRLLRALEVTIGSGRPFSSFGPGVDAYPTNARFALVGVWLPRRVLARRIEQRVADMMAAGLLDEVRCLTLGPTARQALGYKELLDHVETGAELTSCVERTITRTRELGRRQRAWFRRDPRIRWHGTQDDPGRLLDGLGEELARCQSSAAAVGD